MNMNFKKSKGMYLILCVCLVIAISLFITHSKNNKSNNDNTKVVNAEHNESKVINFLKDNYSSIDASDNNDFLTFKLLDSSLKDNEVFFTAENHGAAVNSELELKFIKYLKEKVGIKYCLLEPFTKEDITLFKLTGNQSPFQQEVIWPFDVNSAGIIPREGVTTDYFQYMILIKNSKATTPLSK